MNQGCEPCDILESFLFDSRLYKCIPTLIIVKVIPLSFSKASKFFDFCQSLIEFQRRESNFTNQIVGFPMQHTTATPHYYDELQGLI